MDWPIIEQKLESLQRCLRRLIEKCPKDAATLEQDIDAQDILSLNLTRAVQLCIDIGSHIIASTHLPPPDTMGQTFDLLFQTQIINESLAQRMKQAVGFRNLAVHNYDAINWGIVFKITQTCLTDFGAFAEAVMRLQITNPPSV